MNTLKELIFILEQHKSTFLTSWLYQNTATNMVKLYYGFANDSFKNDDEASIALYGKAGSASYHKLKFDLRNRLYEFIPYIEVRLTKKNDAEEERFRCHQLLMSFNILLRQSGDAAAVEMGEYIFEKCLKYGFTDLAYLATKRITGKISNPKKMEFYTSEAKRLHILEGLELEAKVYYNEILYLYGNHKSNPTELQILIRQKYEDFIKIKGDATSPAIEVYSYLLEICVHSIENNSKATFETAIKAANYFESLPVRYPQALKSYYSYLIVGYTQQKDYVTAQIYIKKCLECVVEGTSSWLKVLELAFVSYLHAGEYMLATDTWMKATNDKFTKSFSPQVHEVWTIYYAYLHVLILSKTYIPTDKQKPKLKKDFRLSKFKNEITFYDKEKSGMNINIVLVEILILIVEKNFDTLSDRFEALQKYVQRYTDESAYMERIKLIFKLIFIGIRHNFASKELSSPTANAIYQSLKEQSSDLGDEAYELEIIPYQKVWEIIL